MNLKTPSAVSSIQPQHENAVPRLTTPSNRPSNAITCLRCDNWWTGLLACHCAGCHRTFTSASAFDTHRRGGKCLDPARTRTRKGKPAFEIAERSWPGWSLPGTWNGPDE